MKIMNPQLASQSQNPTCVAKSKPNLRRNVKKCPLPSVFRKNICVLVLCRYIRKDYPTCNSSRTMWQSISICFVCSWNTGFATIYKTVWLSQKSRASKLHDTFKSCNKYYNQTIIGHRAVFRFHKWCWYFCLFFGHLWDSKRTKKNAIPESVNVWLFSDGNSNPCPGDHLMYF